MKTSSFPPPRAHSRALPSTRDTDPRPGPAGRWARPGHTRAALCPCHGHNQHLQEPRKRSGASLLGSALSHACPPVLVPPLSVCPSSAGVSRRAGAAARAGPAARSCFPCKFQREEGSGRTGGGSLTLRMGGEGGEGAPRHLPVGCALALLRFQGRDLPAAPGYFHSSPPSWSLQAPSLHHPLIFPRTGLCPPAQRRERPESCLGQCPNVRVSIAHTQHLLTATKGSQPKNPFH